MNKLKLEYQDKKCLFGSVKMCREELSVGTSVTCSEYKSVLGTHCINDLGKFAKINTLHLDCLSNPGRSLLSRVTDCFLLDPLARYFGKKSETWGYSPGEELYFSKKLAAANLALICSCTYIAMTVPAVAVMFYGIGLLATIMSIGIYGKEQTARMWVNYQCEMSRSAINIPLNKDYIRKG